MSSTQEPGRGWSRPVLARDLTSWAGAAPEPLDRAEVASRTAAMVVAAAADDEQARQRLTRLLDDVGLDTLAELWQAAPHGSLAHTLWTLHALAAWCRREPERVAALFDAGRHAAEVSAAVAGTPQPADPAAMTALADALLHGTWSGGLADACDRAAGFARVVAEGRRAQAAGRADLDDPVRERRLALANDRAAERLSAAGRAWRAGLLG